MFLIENLQRIKRAHIQQKKIIRIKMNLELMMLPRFISTTKSTKVTKVFISASRICILADTKRSTL